MRKVITYNFTEDFIKRLAEHIDENYLRAGREISRLAVVFGGRRPALFLKKELARRIKKAFYPPTFFSIDEFVDYTVSRKVHFSKIADLDLCYLIYNLAKEGTPEILKTRPSFAEFLPWAREILSFVEQLDLEDVDQQSLKSIEQNAQIGYAIPEDINVLLENIIALREACHRDLKDQKMYYRGLRYLIASRIIKDIDFPEFDQFLFCNFFYLHKTESIIVKSLYDRDKALLFFQGNEDNWPVLKKLSNQFLMPIKPSQPSAEPNFKFYLYAGFDAHSQVSLVREILKQIKDFDQTVIVLPNPNQIIPLLSEITSLVDDFNVSMGYPLKRSTFFTLFEFIFKAQKSKRQGRYYTKDYLNVLRHPFVKNLKLFKEPMVTRILVHKIEEILIGKEKTSLGGSLFIRLDDLQNLNDLYDVIKDTLLKVNIEVSFKELSNIVKQLHQILFLYWEKVDNFHGFALVLKEFLDIFINKSPLRAYPLNLKITQKMLAIQEELKNLTFNQEIFLSEEIFKIFLQRVEREKVAFLGSPLKGLQILGLFETRSLNFNNVIVLDVNEGVLPMLRIYEPLIPREVMVNLNLDRLEQEEEIQRYQFMRLISGAKNVHLVYEESKDKEKSRFLEELIWNKQKRTKNFQFSDVRHSSFSVKVASKKTAVPKTQEIIERLKGFRYSSTSINTYVKCPLRFYYQYVLGLKEKEDLLEEPENREVGIFIHELLESTFNPFIGQKPIIDQRFRKHFLKIFEQKFMDSFGKSMKSDSFLLKNVMEVRLSRFLDKENQASPKDTRDVKELICIEKHFEDNVRLAVGELHFVYKVDRIDRLDDETILIIDYKTGSNDPMPKAIDHIESMELNRANIKNMVKSFQIPLYFQYLDKEYPNESINAAFYNLRTLEVAQFIDQKMSFDRHYIIGIFARALNFIIGEIFDPQLDFHPDDHDPRYCSVCPFYYMCR